MTQYSTNFQYTLLLFLNPFGPFPNLAYIVCVIIQNKDEHRLESKNRSSLYNSLSYFTPNKESLSRECLDVVRSTFGRLMSTQSHRRTILYSKYVTAPSNQCFVCVSECVWIMGVVVWSMCMLRRHYFRMRFAHSEGNTFAVSRRQYDAFKTIFDRLERSSNYESPSQISPFI